MSLPGNLPNPSLAWWKPCVKQARRSQVINKVDLLNDFAALEARKKQVEEFGIFDAIVTVSAKDGTGCEELFPLLKQYANPGPHYFDDDAFTDMPEKELVAELVREKPCCSCGKKSPTALPLRWKASKNARTAI